MYTYRTHQSMTSVRKFNPAFMLIVATLILSVSCKKGDTGPAGPAGTANVMYSDWFTPASYKKDTVFGAYGFNYDKAEPAITQSIADSGTVITYGKLDGYNQTIWPTAQVSVLPIAITYMVLPNTPNIDTWSAFVTAGNLRIRLVSSLNQYGSISNLHQFRYIIIPGGKKVGTSAVSPKIRNGQGSLIIAYAHMSYDELCKTLGIPQ
jgi:hypothetical protein